MIRHVTYIAIAMVVAIPACTASKSKLVTIPTSSVGVSSSVTGRLAVSGDCVWIVGRGFRYPIVFPSGTSMHGVGDDEQITDPNGSSRREGQKITVQGGIIDVDRSPQPEEIRDYGRRCGRAVLFASSFMR